MPQWVAGNRGQTVDSGQSCCWARLCCLGSTRSTRARACHYCNSGQSGCWARLCCGCGCVRACLWATCTCTRLVLVGQKCARSCTRVTVCARPCTRVTVCAHLCVRDGCRGFLCARGCGVGPSDGGSEAGPGAGGEAGSVDPDGEFRCERERRATSL